MLTDARFLVSSLCVNKPCRLHGLLLVMTCALRVDAVAPRRLRPQLARHRETGPNQSSQPTARPTWRWVFQRREGNHRGRLTMPGQVHDLSEGLHEVPRKILRWFGGEVCWLDQIFPREGRLNVGSKENR